jgi:hypothetical protein
MTSTVYKIIDKHLQALIDSGINKTPKKIQTEMSDPNKDPKDEWRIWLPIKSTVTDEEIFDVEKIIGYKLPADYKFFLKYKHFYELYIDQASFGEHPINIWRSSLTNGIFDGYPRELLIDKGYIPFANWSDWGLLCFDATKKNTDNYPIVLWDHEAFDHFQLISNDFESLIIHLDNEATKNSN